MQALYIESVAFGFTGIRTFDASLFTFWKAFIYPWLVVALSKQNMYRGMSIKNRFKIHHTEPKGEWLVDVNLGSSWQLVKRYLEGHLHINKEFSSLWHAQVLELCSRRRIGVCYTLAKSVKSSHFLYFQCSDHRFTTSQRIFCMVTAMSSPV